MDKLFSKIIVGVLLIALAGLGALNMFNTTRTYAAIDHLQESKVEVSTHTKEHKDLEKIIDLKLAPIVSKQAEMNANQTEMNDILKRIEIKLQ